MNIVEELVTTRTDRCADAMKAPPSKAPPSKPTYSDRDQLRAMEALALEPSKQSICGQTFGPLTLDSLPKAKRPRQDVQQTSIGDPPMGSVPPVTEASAKAQQTGGRGTPAGLPDPSDAPHSVDEGKKVERQELHKKVWYKHDWKRR